jgi:hypothetical protein
VQNNSVTLEADKERREEIHKHVEGKQTGLYVNIFTLKREKNKC